MRTALTNLEGFKAIKRQDSLRVSSPKSLAQNFWVKKTASQFWFIRVCSALCLHFFSALSVVVATIESSSESLGSSFASKQSAILLLFLTKEFLAFGNLFHANCIANLIKLCVIFCCSALSRKCVRLIAACPGHWAILKISKHSLYVA